LETEKERRPLIKILQFRLNRETENIRDDFLKNLVRMGLFLGNKQLIRIEEISETLCREYSICSLPTPVLKKYLDELVATGRVIAKDGKYVLPEKEKKEILRATEEKKKLQREIFDKLVSYVKQEYKHLSEDQEKAVIDNFRLFLTEYLTVKGTISAEILTRTSEQIRIPGTIYLLDNTVQKLEDPRLQRIQKDAIIKLFTEADQSFCNFLYDALQKYIYFEVLDFDPECRVLERGYISKMVLFLDTNVILDLICPTEERHEITKETIELAKMLGIKMIISSVTKDEIIAHCSKTNTRYASLSKQLSEKALEKISVFESGLIRTFLQEKKSNPSLNFEYYVLSLQKSLERRLHSQFSIECEDKKREEILKDPDFSVFSELVSKCANRYAQFKDSEVIDHDAYCLLLIRELRIENGDGILGPSYWFVTSDNSLDCVSDALIKDGKIGEPLSLRIDNLLDILSIFLPLEMAEQKSATISSLFLKFCASSFTPPLPEINRELLMKIAGPWMEYDLLTSEEIADIISTTFVRDHVSARPPAESVENLAFEVQRKAFEKTKQEMDKVLGEAAELKKELEKLRRRPIIPLFLVGLTSFVMILILAFTSAVQKLAIPDIVYICLTILAILFIASSFFGWRVFKRIRLKLG
jgi:hypothetical protein